MKEVMISPEMYEETIKHYTLNELEKEFELQNKYLNNISIDNMSERITRYEYINVINKVKQDQEHVNELVMKKIARFIEWDDPKLQSYYRTRELETFKNYKMLDELPTRYDNWKKMALVEIEEEKILNPIEFYNIEEIKNQYYRSIEKQREVEKVVKNNKIDTEQVINFIDEKISQIENGEIENHAVKENNKKINSELDNMINNIDNFLEKLNAEPEPVIQLPPTPEELEKQEKIKEIKITRELRDKVSSAIRVYQEGEWPHIDIEKLADGSLKIDYPERIIELKEFILNSEYYNKEYAIPIEKILSKDIVCLTKEEALAYICYAFKMEEKQKGFIANMINSNAFSMLCARIYNNTYNL